MMIGGQVTLIGFFWMMLTDCGHQLDFLYENLHYLGRNFKKKRSTSYIGWEGSVVSDDDDKCLSSCHGYVEALSVGKEAQVTKLFEVISVGFRTHRSDYDDFSFLAL